MLPFPATAHPALKSPRWIGAMACIAVGMFVGAWVIGPALSNGPSEYAKLRSAKQERAAFESAIARPDPSPYRYATPVFDMPNQPEYGKIAKMRAQSGYSAQASNENFRVADHPQVNDAFGGIGWQDNDAREYRPAPQQSYRQRDRHTGTVY